MCLIFETGLSLCSSNLQQSSCLNLQLHRLKIYTTMLSLKVVVKESQLGLDDSSIAKRWLLHETLGLNPQVVGAGDA